MPGAGGLESDGWAHGWVVLSTPRTDSDEGAGDAEPSVGLWHLPPRATSDSGTLGAAAGSIRRAKRLAEMPEAIAASAERVYLVFDPDGAGRRVLSLAAYPGHFPSTWVYMPGGRLRVHESLPGGGRLAGLGVSPRGLVALLVPGERASESGAGSDAAPDSSEGGSGREPEGGEAGPGDAAEGGGAGGSPLSAPRLLLLTRQGWRSIEKPNWPEGAGSPETLRLLRDPRGATLIAAGRDGSGWVASGAIEHDRQAEEPEPDEPDAGDSGAEATGSGGSGQAPAEGGSPAPSGASEDGADARDGPPTSRPEPDDAPGSEQREAPAISPEWRVEPLPAELAAAAGGDRLDGGFVWRGQPILLRRDVPGEVEVLTREGGGAIRLARVRGAGSDFAAAELRDSDRLALVWLEPADDTPGPTPVPSVDVLVKEISLISGEEIHSGEAVFSTPVSPGEFRIIAISLLGLMALVLLYVLRGVGREASGVVLPEGWALAPGGARLIGFAGDALLAAGICALALGIPVGEAYTIEALTTSREGHWGLPLTLAIGTLLSTLSEWLTGCTPGKLLAGIRVARAQEALANPGPVAALVRNICKWWLAPVAMFALGDPSGRHRGDVQAGTIVVRRAASGDAGHSPESGE